MKSIKLPKTIEFILIVLSLYCILFNVQIIPPLCINNILFFILSVGLCFFLLLYVHPILAILICWIVFNYYFNQHKNMASFTSSSLSPHHQFPYTLEQEIVKKMAPIPQKKIYMQPATYKPSLDSVYDGEPLSVSQVS